MTQDTPTIALIHAVIPAMPPMREVLAAELPDARVLNLLDEGLLSEVERRGGLTLEALPGLAAQVELVLLAQASMARLVPRLPALPVPVLTSPRLAVDHLRRLLQAEPRSWAVHWKA